MEHLDQLRAKQTPVRWFSNSAELQNHPDNLKRILYCPLMTGPTRDSDLIGPGGGVAIWIFKSSPGDFNEGEV